MKRKEKLNVIEIGWSPDMKCPKCQSSEIDRFYFVQNKSYWDCGKCGHAWYLEIKETTSPAPPQTKGDKARQMSNTELAITMFRLAKCEECPCDKSKCRCIRTAQCLDNWAEYFNAPAYAPDINVGTKESEVKR